MHSIDAVVEVKICVVWKSKRHTLKITPTCFRSHRFHHQGVTACTWLKLHMMVHMCLLCAWSVFGSIFWTCGVCVCALRRAEKYMWTIIYNFNQVQAVTPWWWILCDPKHVGVIFNVCLLDFYTTEILMFTTVLIECISWLIKVTNNNDARWKPEINWIYWWLVICIWSFESHPCPDCSSYITY